MRKEVLIIVWISAILLCLGMTVSAQETTLKSNTSPSAFQHAPIKPRPAMSDSARQKRVSVRSTNPMTSFAPDSVQTSADGTSPKRTMIFLEQTDVMSFDQERLPDVQLLRGNVILRHDSAYLYCDSAYFNQVANSFTAYSNVRIEQGDTLFVYGDILYYDGNTKMAKLRNNVKMQNRDVVLTTDSLNYDRMQNVGYYFNGGRITDGENVLKSRQAYYYPGQRTAVFNKDVVGTNPTMLLNSDTLRYNTDDKRATILGPTTILHDGKTEIYSEYGWYNLDSEISQLLKNSSVTHEDGKQLKGDTIYYDKKRGLGKAFTNVELIDTTNKLILTGNYGYYEENGELALVTDKALMQEYGSGDTLYLSADTLYSYADSIYKTVQAFHNVRFFRDDLQGVSDSMYFNSRDSILHLLNYPILWSDQQQLTGDTIRVFSKNGGVDYIHVLNNAFATQQEDSIRFNQMSGKEILGYIRDNKLQHVEILGNAESLFFPKDGDDLIGMNQTESSVLMIYFNDGKVYRIVAKPSPKAVTYPLDKVTTEQMYLRNYSWYDYLRPLKWEDVFLRPKMVVQSMGESMHQLQREKERSERDAARKQREAQQKVASDDDDE